MRDEAKPSDVAAERHADAAAVEMRLAVVLYGGISLAIYMHGVVKELFRLVEASHTFVAAPTADNPFPSGSTHALYFDALRRRHHEQGVPTRVAVDIISGTSAGGINGVVLAKGLAVGAAQDGLTDLWLGEGDISRLVEGPRWIPYPLRVVAALVRRRPPLRGDRFCRVLSAALADMDTRRHGTTLVPDGLPLRLFVSVADLRGLRRRFPLGDPAYVEDRVHHQVMRFTHTDGRNDFAPGSEHPLAFAGRASSSLPGGFPPLNVADYAAHVGISPEELLHRLHDHLAVYQAEPDADLSEAYFVDGGIIDNFPFEAAVAAIPTQPASTEVDRRLLYLEPDPAPSGADGHAAGRGRPTLREGIIQGLFSARTHEPIAASLEEIADRNAQVRMIRDVIEATFPTIRHAVDDLIPATVDTDGLWAATQAAERRAAQTTVGHGDGYEALRRASLTDTFADMVLRRHGLPAATTPARFITASFRAVLRSGTVPVETAGDVAYQQRHTRFLLAGVGWWYRDQSDGTGGIPARPLLDMVKSSLRDHLASLRATTVRVQDLPEVAGAADKVLSPDLAWDAIKQNQTPERFAADHFDELDALAATYHRHLAAQLAEHPRRLTQLVAETVAGWPEPARGDMLVRYLGFPMWDRLTFPLQALTGLDERAHVEVSRFSPDEARHLPGVDLRGRRLWHLGALFRRSHREHDYLVGRLHGLGQLLRLLGDDSAETWRLGAPTILDEEANRLSPKVIEELRPKARIPSA